MQTKVEAFNKIVDKALKDATSIYVDAVREVLNHCSTLDHYIDAMGTQFFVRKDGEIVYEFDDLPKRAQDFMDNMAQPYLETFRSLGWQIHRNHIVKYW